MKNNLIRMSAAEESFLLLHPNPNRNSHEVARQIAACSGVRKVFITSGDFGFVVSTSQNGEHHAKKVRKMVKRVAGSSRSKVAIGHFAYATR